MNKELYNKLTSEELGMIKNYIEEYATDGRHVEVSLYTLLRFWNREKKNLFTLLGNNLSIHKQVVSEKEKEQIETEMIEKLQVSTSDFYRNFSTWRRTYFHRSKADWYPDVDLRGVFDSQEDYRAVQNLVDVDCLVNNRYSGKRITMHMPSGHDYTFCEGTKTLKILKKIADEFNIEGFEDYRLTHSQILNEKTIKGEMYLSIHPLDFMTMSDNENGWSSCMSWENEGDYRRGTVEMMNSPMVIEAFIPSVTNMKMPGGNMWNNKRWRQLFIVNEDCIVAIKGYPYWNKGLEKAALKWIKELATENLGWKYQDTLFTYYNSSESIEYFDQANNIWIDTDYKIKFETDAMYNDLYSEHRLFLSTNYPAEQEETFYYSGEAPCMICGGINDIYYENESDLICEKCVPHLWCNECGSRLSSDEAITVDGEIYCQYCAANLSICDGCEESHTESCLTTYRLGNKETGEVYSIIREFCEDCVDAETYFPQKAIFEVERECYNWFGTTTETKYVIDISQLTADGCIVFDDPKEELLEHVNWIYTYNGYKYNCDGIDKQVDITEKNLVYDLKNLFLKVKITEYPQENKKVIVLKDNGNYSFISYENKTNEELCYELLKMIYPDAPEEELRAFHNYNVQLVVQETPFDGLASTLSAIANINFPIKEYSQAETDIDSFVEKYNQVLPF